MSVCAELFAIPESLLDELRESAEARAEWLGDPSELATHGLDKRWQALHFLLTGTAWDTPEPLGLAILGGRDLSADDMGHGPARYLSAAQVRAVADALAALSSDELRGRFDAARMTELEIYPNVWEREPEDAEHDLLERFERLRSYYMRAADAGLAMLLWIA